MKAKELYNTDRYKLRSISVKNTLDQTFLAGELYYRIIDTTPESLAF